MIAANARGGEGLQISPRQRGHVTIHDHARILRLLDDGQHLFIGIDDAVKIHDLAQPEHPVIAQHFRRVPRADFGARRFEGRRAGHGGRGHHINPKGQPPALFAHQRHAGRPKNIRNFVRVRRAGRRAERHHRFRKGRGQQHRAFDVHMPVNQPGQHAGAVSLQRFKGAERRQLFARIGDRISDDPHASV